jgi:hypothetical protein
MSLNLQNKTAPYLLIKLKKIIAQIKRIAFSFTKPQIFEENHYLFVVSSVPLRAKMHPDHLQTTKI